MTQSFKDDSLAENSIKQKNLYCLYGIRPGSIFPQQYDLELHFIALYNQIGNYRKNFYIPVEGQSNYNSGLDIPRE